MLAMTSAASTSWCWQVTSIQGMWGYGLQADAAMGFVCVHHNIQEEAQINSGLDVTSKQWSAAHLTDDQDGVSGGEELLLMGDKDAGGGA